MSIDEFVLQQQQEERDDDPYNTFMCGLKAPETRRQWPNRLKIFFNFGIDSKLKIEEQSSIFYQKSLENPRWTFVYFIKFIEYQKQRVKKGEIENTTIHNYYKTAKLFCEMNDITSINWKKLSRALPQAKKAADDRAPTLEEIKKLLEYPDIRMKPIILTMISSGMRKEAWDHLKWKHIIPIYDDEKNLLAAKIIVYPGDNEEYYSFITPEAYNSLKEWMDFRARHGEKISPNSWLMRNLFVTSERNWRTKKDPNRINSKVKKLSCNGIKSMIERAIHSQGLWTPLEEGSRRREWKGMHGFRKFFKTQSEKVMKSLHVEMMLGHNTGLAKNYYRPHQRELLEEYIKAIDHLTVNDEYRLSKQVQELTEKNEDSEYVIKGKLQEKDEQIKIIQSQMNVLVGIITRLDSEEGKNKIAKQLIENGLFTK